MNWLDLVFIGVIAISVIIGVVRGFVREVLSVVVWVAAVWIGLRYAGALAIYLADYVDSPTLRVVGAFVGLFVATLLLGALINFLAASLVDRTGLTGTDRALGVVFGGLRGCVIVAMLVLMAGLTSLPRERWWQESLVAAWFTPWVCSAGVGGWLDALRLPAPLLDEQDAAAARQTPGYWVAFCDGETRRLRAAR